MEQAVRRVGDVDAGVVALVVVRVVEDVVPVAALEAFELGDLGRQFDCGS